MPRICSGRLSQRCGNTTLTSQPARTRSYSQPPTQPTTSAGLEATTSSRYLAEPPSRCGACGRRFSKSTSKVPIASLQQSNATASSMTRSTQRDTSTSICKVSIGSRLAPRVELGEDFVGVLAQLWRGRSRSPRRAMEIRRCRDHRNGALSVGHVDHAAGGVELLVGDDILDRVDRRPEEIRFAGEDLRPLVKGVGGKDLIQLADQLDGVDGT